MTVESSILSGKVAFSSDGNNDDKNTLGKGTLSLNYLRLYKLSVTGNVDDQFSDIALDLTTEWPLDEARKESENVFKSTLVKMTIIISFYIQIILRILENNIQIVR